MTAHRRVAGRIYGYIAQGNGPFAPSDVDNALADVPTFELAAVLAERWAAEPSQHAFVRTPPVEPEPAPGFTLTLRDDVGSVAGHPPAPFADWQDAKREAILRNRRRPDPTRWWVVADGAGVPLVPQP